LPVVVVFGSGDNIVGSFEHDSAELAGKSLANLVYNITIGNF
jgi:hypothetical protein